MKKLTLISMVTSLIVSIFSVSTFADSGNQCKIESRNGSTVSWTVKGKAAKKFIETLDDMGILLDPSLNATGGVLCSYGHDKHSDVGNPSDIRESCVFGIGGAAITLKGIGPSEFDRLGAADQNEDSMNYIGTSLALIELKCSTDYAAGAYQCTLTEDLKLSDADSSYNPCVAVR